MVVGVLKEIKPFENRVALLPVGVELFRRNGHTVLVESQAGEPSGFSDEAYAEAGAEIVQTAEEVYERCEMVMKVKEPLPREYGLMRDDQVIFTYFHFAADEALTHAFIKSGAVAVAYETIETPDGRLPLLTPMSEVAGRMAVQQAAKYLERAHGGRGILLGGVPGVEPAKVVVLGGGVVGTNAAKMAAGLGAQVYILDISLERLRYLNDVMPPNVVTVMSDPHTIRSLLKLADVVISGVLVHGGRTPKLITRDMISTMKRGAVVVDTAIDQGGTLETSRPTTHLDPIYEVDGVVHYCVTNMPGAMPVTSTIALTNATLPYALELANRGYNQAMLQNSAIYHGANIVKGRVTYRGVAEAFGLEYTPLEEVLCQV